MKLRLVASICLVLLILPVVKAEIVEEVVAVVAGSPLLRSDLALAETIRFVERAPEEDEAGYMSRLLDARIRLEAQYRDLETSGLLFRLDIDTEAGMRTLHRRTGGAVGELLAERGLGEEDLLAVARRVAAVEAYIEQRLRPRVAVTPEEIRAAHQRLLPPPRPPLEDVRDELERLLVERALNDRIESWTAQARARQEILRFLP